MRGYGQKVEHSLNLYVIKNWNLAAIGTGVPNDWDSLILKRWDR